MALFLRYPQRFLPTLDRCHCFTVNIGNYLPRSLELDKKSPFEAFFFVPPLIWNPFTTALPTSSGQEARLMFKENCKNWHLKPRRRDFHFLFLDYNWQLEFQYEGSILCACAEHNFSQTSFEFGQTPKTNKRQGNWFSKHISSSAGLRPGDSEKVSPLPHF